MGCALWPHAQYSWQILYVASLEKITLHPYSHERFFTDSIFFFMISFFITLDVLKKYLLSQSGLRGNVEND